MYLKAFDDSDNEIALSANSAILLPAEGEVGYAEPVGQGTFQAQQNFITELEDQMSSLGISTLFAQKMGAETAESKRLSRTDSDSLLSIVSKDLERCLQNAIDIAAAYRDGRTASTRPRLRHPGSRRAADHAISKPLESRRYYA